MTKTTNVKLSELQNEAFEHTIRGGTRLIDDTQYGFNVNRYSRPATFDAIVKAGLLEFVQIGFPLRWVRLTDAGREYARERGWLAAPVTEPAPTPDAAPQPAHEQADAVGVHLFAVGDDVRFRYGTSPLKVHALINEGKYLYIVEGWEGVLTKCEGDEIVPKGATSNWGREGYDAEGWLIEATPPAATSDAPVSRAETFPIGGDSDTVYNALVVLHDIGSPAQERMATRAQEALERLQAERDSLRAELEYIAKMTRENGYSLVDATGSAKEALAKLTTTN